MDIALIGKNGFLGSNLLQLLSGLNLNISGFGRAEMDLDIFKEDQVRAHLKNKKFKFGIICAALTNIDTCFLEKERSERINVVNTIRLLNLFKELDIIPIFFSSDYVFEGILKSYSESDLCRPQTEYGKQKLQVENYIKNNFTRFLIFRTSKMMSQKNHPKNLISQLITTAARGDKIKSFVDQWMNPVFVEDIALVLSQAVEHQLSGIYHLGTRQVLSRFEFAQEAVKKFSLAPELVVPIQLIDIKFHENRSQYSVLNTNLITSKLNLKFMEFDAFHPSPDWQTGF